MRISLKNRIYKSARSFIIIYFQAARHMLGLQQASFAGGPGKRSDPYMNLNQVGFVNMFKNNDKATNVARENDI